MNKIVNRGALIVVEGVDKSGKSTQCKVLLKLLSENGYSVKALRFPDRTTKTGALISDYLQNETELDDRAVHLLFSANRWEQRNSILNDLQNGISLLVDRYAFSGVAFTHAKPGLSLDWCKCPDIGLPKPDLVLFLDLKISESEKRGDFGGERYEQTDFQKKVSDNYKKLFDDTWKVVDASLSLEKVTSLMQGHIESVIKEVANQPVQTLWTD